jgi:hypothetical protein
MYKLIYWVIALLHLNISCYALLYYLTHITLIPYTYSLITCHMILLHSLQFFSTAFARNFFRSDKYSASAPKISVEIHVVTIIYYPTEIKMCWQIFVNHTNIKFCANPGRSLRQTDTTKCFSKIWLGLQSVLPLSFIALGTQHSRCETQQHCFIMTEALSFTVR